MKALAKLKHAEQMEMDIIRAEHAMGETKKKKKKGDPAAVRVFARWKPLKPGQVGLPKLKLTATSIEFEVPDLKAAEQAASSLASQGGGGGGGGLSRKASSKPDVFHCEMDAVFTGKSSQLQVYEEAALPLVDDLLAGYNATLFAYGQTGAGKTFSMYGPDEVLADIAGAPEEVRGLVPKTCDKVFSAIENLDALGVKEVSVYCSMLEIYNERVNDLLMLGQDLKLREDKQRGVFVEGLAAIQVASQQAVCDVITQGNKSRATSATAMNERSSRGHSVFMMEVVCLRVDSKKTAAKLYLVDLAGSEDVKKSKVTGDKTALAEAQNINKSLSALANCIQKLTTGDIEHVPYRDSKLTRILQQALGGNCKTSLLVALRPEADCAVECIATLRFAKRAKQLVKKITVNVESVDADDDAAGAAGGGGGGAAADAIAFAEFAKKEVELAEARAQMAEQIRKHEDQKLQMAAELERLRREVEEEHARVEAEAAKAEEHAKHGAELEVRHEQDERKLADARSSAAVRGLRGTVEHERGRVQAAALLEVRRQLAEAAAAREELARLVEEQQGDLAESDELRKLEVEALEAQLQLLATGMEALKAQQQEDAAAQEAAQQALQRTHAETLAEMHRRTAALEEVSEIHKAAAEGARAQLSEAQAQLIELRAAAAAAGAVAVANDAAAGASLETHAAAARQAAAERDAARAQLEALQAEHARAAAALAKATEHVHQLEGISMAHKAGLEAATKYGQQMEQDRKELKAELAELRLARGQLTPRRTDDPGGLLWCLAPRRSPARISGGGGGGAFATPLLNGMLQAAAGGDERESSSSPPRRGGKPSSKSRSAAKTERAQERPPGAPPPYVED